jgi:hypothetical protein
MREVWLARELRLGRKLALKLLPADLTLDPVRVSASSSEARAESALNHPNVRTIRALGETTRASTTSQNGARAASDMVRTPRRPIPQAILNC